MHVFPNFRNGKVRRILDPSSARDIVSCIALSLEELASELFVFGALASRVVPSEAYQLGAL